MEHVKTYDMKLIIEDNNKYEFTLSPTSFVYFMDKENNFYSFKHDITKKPELIDNEVYNYNEDGKEIYQVVIAAHNYVDGYKAILKAIKSKKKLKFNDLIKLVYAYLTMP